MVLPRGERRVIVQDGEELPLLWFKDQVYAIENRYSGSSNVIANFLPICLAGSLLSLTNNYISWLILKFSTGASYVTPLPLVHVFIFMLCIALSF